MARHTLADRQRDEDEREERDARVSEVMQRALRHRDKAERFVEQARATRDEMLRALRAIKRR